MKDKYYTPSIEEFYVGFELKKVLKMIGYEKDTRENS